MFVCCCISKILKFVIPLTVKWSRMKCVKDRGIKTEVTCTGWSSMEYLCIIISLLKVRFVTEHLGAWFVWECMKTFHSLKFDYLCDIFEKWNILSLFLGMPKETAIISRNRYTI
jgi:hypothetical protein